MKSRDDLAQSLGYLHMSRVRKPGVLNSLSALGYALRLSDYHDYGQCGLSETPDSEIELSVKVARLVEFMRESPHTVVHTGAGISTAAGIPDFRGAGGVWTRHKKGEALPAAERCWNNALPTQAHMILSALVEAGKVAAVITQNIDGLHVRSGIRRECLAELHGNIFAEKCSACEVVVTRSFDCGGVGFRPTGRLCQCGGAMVDQLLDWEDDLPERDFDLAEKVAGL
jgi:mono-ADP-ribosyltransferase sirtuin 6